jgi:hypothetical protein
MTSTDNLQDLSDRYRLAHENLQRLRSAPATVANARAICSELTAIALLRAELVSARAAKAV